MLCYFWWHCNYKWIHHDKWQANGKQRGIKAWYVHNGLYRWRLQLDLRFGPWWLMMQTWSQSPGLASWVKRQRAAKAEGELNQERLQILHALGFEFGEVAVITQEWENWFDALVEWVMQHSENGEEVDWSGLDWCVAHFGTTLILQCPFLVTHIVIFCRFFPVGAGCLLLSFRFLCL